MAEGNRLIKLLGVSSAIDRIKALVDARVKLIKYDIKDELAKALSNVFVSILLLVFLSFGLLMISIGLAVYLGGLLENYFYGFAIIAGFYFLLFILLFLLKDKLGLKEAIEKQLNSVLDTNN